MNRNRFFASIAAVLLLSVFAWLLLPFVNHAGRDIAFMGDSLTQGWAFPRENFGMYGQTTAQMLDRFQRQVPGHRKVVILGGTNDTLLGLDPTVTVRNLDVMIELAHRDGVEPILAEIPPIYREGGRYLPAVHRLNAGILQLAAWRHVRLVDYNTALQGHTDAYSDGTHLKRRGYLRMEWALLHTTNIF